MIWKPDLLVYNNADMNIRNNELQTNVRIDNTGRISLFRALITDISCDLNMQKFPFDHQICYIMLASWSYDGSQIMLHTVKDPANVTNPAALTHYIPNMEWKLIDFKYTVNLKYYECCPYPYPDISYFFAIKRNPSYYLFTLIVPSAFINIVTVIGFFTPYSSTGENSEKVSLGVTALLSLAIILMMVSDKLPATSNSVPLLGQYYIGLIFIMFTATYCTTWTLSVQMHGNAGRPIPQRIRAWLLNCKMGRYCIIAWFFGRELLNIQESIRMRLKKYDKLNELKRNFAQQFLNLQHHVLKIDEFSHHNSQSTSGELCKRHPSDEQTTTLVSIIGEILTVVQSIKQDLLAYEHLRRTRKEWQMLARMLEKILMLFFIVFTTIFALVMLYDNQQLPLISESFMRDKGKS
uniref:Neuronal acetylcholine receptor subunit alpha-10 n=1 Tax=Ascaris suum TaxID=6253 RepID=F1L7E1_ASCSU